MELNVNSLLFIAIALVGLAVFDLAGTPRRRMIVLTLINLVFLAAVFRPIYEIYLVALYAGLGYAFIRLAAERKSSAFFWAASLTLIAGLVYLKEYSIVGFLPYPDVVLATVGLSFIFFRVMHLFIDVYQGTISEKISPWRYFNYLFFFLSFLSGPVQRYETFCAEVARAATGNDSTPADARRAINRIINGYIKVNIFGAILLEMHLKLIPSLEAQGSGAVLKAILGVQLVELFSAADGTNLLRLMPLHATAALIYALYLYLNFSGYMDIVVGFARLFGISIPENFNRPYAARNFIDFWGRWHITVSEWCRTYIFYPLVKALQTRFPGRATRQPIAVVGLFVTFVLLGVWHGASNAYLFLGLMLGLGVALNKIHQVLMARWIGQKSYAALGAGAVYTALSRGLTISYFAICITCMWITPKLQALLFNPMGMTVMLIEIVLFGIVLGAVYLAVDRLSRLRRPGEKPVRSGFAAADSHLYLALKLMLVLCFMVGQGLPLQFVYANF